MPVICGILLILGFPIVVAGVAIFIPLLVSVFGLHLILTLANKLLGI